MNEKNLRSCLTPSRTATHPIATTERNRLRLRDSCDIARSGRGRLHEDAVSRFRARPAEVSAKAATATG